MVKAIFFDIDGTLLSHRSGRVPASTEAAMSQLKQRGVKLFAATGRHMLELEMLPVHKLPFDGYVTLNGQLCLDSDKTLLYDVPIDAEDTGKLISVFEEGRIPVMVIEKNDMYVNFVNPEVRAVQEAISTPTPELGVYTGNRVYQFVIYGGREQAQAIIEMAPSCKMNEWNEYAFDIIPAIGGKDAGIQYILQHFGVSQNEIMAFGDGNNDIDMLRYANIGVAMGNAGSEVKRQADYVTEDVDNDGIWRALKHYELL